MKAQNKLSILVVMVAAVFFSQDALAKGKKARTLPGGIVFPNMNQGATVNPATLNTQKGQSVQGLYTPQIDASQTSQDFEVSYASSTKNFGLGIGYTGSLPDGGSLVNGAYVGGGFSSGDFGFGASLIEADLNDNTDSRIDAGIDFAADKSLHLGVVGRDVLADTRTITAGVGYQKAGKYNLEVNVTTPPLNNLNSDYVIDLIGGVYVGAFGASFTTSYNLGTDTTTNSVTGLISPMDSLAILMTVNMDGSTRTYQFGLTYSF